MNFLERKQKSLRELLKMTIFSMAFGYIEGAVAHYLRLVYYPEGFNLHVKVMEMNTMLVEMGREVSTLVVILMVILLVSGPFIKRTANFILVFGIWDITYYGALYLFERWPKNLLDWDVLFLIPVPWFAPVLAPVCISVMGILCSLLVNYIYIKYSKIKMGFTALAAFAVALICWLISFIQHASNEYFPLSYNWLLFICGILFAGLGFFALIYKNIISKKTKRSIV